MIKLRKRKNRMNESHLSTLIKRYSRQILTNPRTVFALFLQPPLMLVIVLLVYEKNSFTDPTLIWQANTMVFLLVVISCLMGILNSYREIIKEREILSRELSGGLDWVAYITSKYNVLSAVGFVQCLILVAGSCLFIDFGFGNFWGIIIYFLSMFLSYMGACAVGLLISALVKKGENAVLPLLLAIICMVMFSGTIIEFSGAIQYFEYLIPAYWGASALGKTAGLDFQTVYEHRTILSFLMLVAIIILCYFLTAIVLNKRKKK